MRLNPFRISRVTTSSHRITLNRTFVRTLPPTASSSLFHCVCIEQSAPCVTAIHASTGRSRHSQTCEGSICARYAESRVRFLLETSLFSLCLVLRMVCVCVSVIQLLQRLRLLWLNQSPAMCQRTFIIVLVLCLQLFLSLSFSTCFWSHLISSTSYHLVCLSIVLSHRVACVARMTLSLHGP